jgi:hypothetical protein
MQRKQRAAEQNFIWSEPMKNLREKKESFKAPRAQRREKTKVENIALISVPLRDLRQFFFD